MLSQTTITAMQTLVYIALNSNGEPVPPGEIADRLGASAAYLSKINTQLVKAHILRSHRGVKGGVTLAKPPQNISLLHVVEACQGMILGDYCSDTDNPDVVCGFHAAMHDLRVSFIEALNRWSVADLARKPLPHPAIRDLVACRMRCAVPRES